MEVVSKNGVQSTPEPIQNELTISTKKLNSSIASKNKIAVVAALQPYRKPTGSVNFHMVLSVPLAVRIPEMAKEDIVSTLTIVSSLIALSLESEGVSDDLAISMAEAVVNQAGEDNISMQDVGLFLQDLKGGKHGHFFGSPTVIQFMEKLDEYRQKRYSAMLDIREEEHAQRKGQNGYIPEAPKTPGEQMRREELDNMITEITQKYGKD